ncbi:unnamed protein product, partial [Eretmochelys imbricata]
TRPPTTPPRKWPPRSSPPSRRPVEVADPNRPTSENVKRKIRIEARAVHEHSYLVLDASDSVGEGNFSLAPRRPGPAHREGISSYGVFPRYGVLTFATRPPHRGQHLGPPEQRRRLGQHQAGGAEIRQPQAAERHQHAGRTPGRAQHGDPAGAGRAAARPQGGARRQLHPPRADPHDGR